jgi:hypothetical protein
VPNRLARRDPVASMSQKQYLKSIEKEIQRINKKIDLKILNGEKYSKEARDHRLLLKKIRYHKRKSFLDKFFMKLSSAVRMTIF